MWRRRPVDLRRRPRSARSPAARMAAPSPPGGRGRPAIAHLRRRALERGVPTPGHGVLIGCGDFVRMGAAVWAGGRALTLRSAARSRSPRGRADLVSRRSASSRSRARGAGHRRAVGETLGGLGARPAPCATARRGAPPWSPADGSCGRCRRWVTGMTLLVACEVPDGAAACRTFAVVDSTSSTVTSRARRWSTRLARAASTGVIGVGASSVEAPAVRPLFEYRAPRSTIMLAAVGMTVVGAACLSSDERRRRAVAGERSGQALARRAARPRRRAATPTPASSSASRAARARASRPSRGCCRTGSSRGVRRAAHLRARRHRGRPGAAPDRPRPRDRRAVAPHRGAALRRRQGRARRHASCSRPWRAARWSSPTATSTPTLAYQGAGRDLRRRRGRARRSAGPPPTCGRT